MAGLGVNPEFGPMSMKTSGFPPL